ncbi:choice-of-anchor G family protein [Leifsonia kafniensis]|uniref:choice-of-anchor G family protein n=1 Tax=Leifsonia kafniensis TaxID=475957 RepID=UPI0031EB6DF4
MGSLAFAGLSAPAFAAPGDKSEAEGRILSGGGVINLDGVASLAPAYSGNPSSPAASTSPLSLAVLSALNVDLGSGIKLFGANPVIGVGALGQYASSVDANGASFASSGAIGSDGAIAAGPSGSTDTMFVDATQLLSVAGLDPLTAQLISELRVELGAISATASQTPGALATGDYQIAGGKVVLKSPTLAALTAGLDTTLGTLSTTVNALAGPTGALGSTLSGISTDVVGPLTTAVNTAGLGLLTVNNVGLTAGLTVDLSTALSAITQAPLVSTDGITTINLATGEITIDLAALHGHADHTLNDLDPNTELLSGVVVRTALNSSINSVLNQIPALLVTTVNNTINNATLTVKLTAKVRAIVLDVADVDVTINGTVGQFIAGTVPGSGIDVKAALLGIPVGALVAPILGTVTGTLLPAIVTPLKNAITGVGVGDGLFQPSVLIATTALEPLLDAVNGVVSLKANVQETDGTFTKAGAVSAGSFTERALVVSLLPVLGTPLAQVNLASATVRAAATAVAITSPANNASFTVADAAGTTPVTVTGTGEAGATISVVAGGQTQTATAAADGTWTVTFTALPVGSYTATVTQTAGLKVTTASVNFTVAVAGTTTPGTTTAGTTTPGTTTPGTTTAGTTTPGTTTPGTTTPGTTTAGTTTAGTTTPGTTTAGTTTAGTTTPGTTTAGTTTAGTTTPGTTTPGTTTAGTTTAGTTTAGTTTAGTTTPGTTTAGTTTPGTTTPGTTTAGTTTPGTTTPGTTTPGTTTAGTTTNPDVPSTYTVTFNAQGGSAVKAITAQKGKKFTAPKDPTRTGYAFKGWFTNSDASKKWVWSTPANGNVKLYAGWTKNAATAPTVKRISGDDRYATAVALSKASYPKTAPIVYVATGANFPDALAAAPAAAKLGGPLLLTTIDALPANVTAEIKRLKPSRIVVVGGTAVISDAVLKQLKALQLNTVRLGGADRYETAKMIVTDAFPGTVSEAWLVTGTNFPDALSAAAVAGSRKVPVVLVDGAQSSVDTATKNLLGKLKPSKITIAGGPAAVSPGIEASLKSGYTLARLGGPDRYGTSLAINANSFSNPKTVYLATGAVFADALAGAAVAGATSSPLYVIPNNCVPSKILTKITAWETTKVIVVGGTAALTSAVEKLTPCE